MLTKTYYVSPTAGAGGTGTESNPFNSIHLVPFEYGVHTHIKVSAGTETISSEIVLPAFTTLEGIDGTPVFDAADADIKCLRLTDPVHVTVKNITLQRAQHGIQIDGRAIETLIEDVTAQDMHGLGGFSHEDANEAEGRVVFRRCKAIRCEGDGFSNRGNADDLMIDCDAVHCGPIWGVYELDFKVDDLTAQNPYGAQEDIGYQRVSTTRPTITRNVYVDGDNGNDSNDGLSPSTPWLTLTKVGSSSVAGDRIHLKCGSSFTDACSLKANQEVTTYGSGLRPEINNSNPVFTVAGVSNVWIEGIAFNNAEPGVLVTGTVSNVWVVDCDFYRSDSYGVQANDAAGSGDVNIFGCHFWRGDTGSVSGAAGSYTINAWKCRGEFAGAGTNSASSGAWVAAGSCVFNLYDVWEKQPSYRGFDLGGTGNHTVQGCWVTDPVDTAATTDRIAINVTGSGDTEISRTVIALPNPGTGEKTIGINHTGTGSDLKVYNCTVQDMRTTGGTGSTAILVGANARTIDARNNVFDAGTAGAGTYYWELDATRTNTYTIDYNVYFDPSGAGTLTNFYDTDGATTMNIATFGAIDGVDELLAAHGRLVTNQATTTLPAVNGPWDARLDDGNSEQGREDGLDLNAAGLVSWTTDAGFRPYTYSPTDLWTRGAYANYTGSPDGYTTHADSGMRLEGCTAIWCANGIDFTHDHVTTDETCGLFDCVFWECYDGAVNQAICRPFPIKDCTFYGGIRAAVDINPPSGASGDEWFIEGCEFIGARADAMVKLRTAAAAMTYNVSSCIFWGPERTYETVGAASVNLLRVSNAATANVDNCAFFDPGGCNSLSEIKRIILAEGTSTVNLHNALCYTPDKSFTRYTRGDNAARFGSVDNNYYFAPTTNTTKWRAGGADVDFAGWQSAISDDAAAVSSTEKISGRPEVGERRYPGAEAFKVSPYSTAGAGADRSVNSRAAFGGAIRPTAAAWSLGPWAGAGSADSLFRTDYTVVFSDFALETRYSEDFLLTESSGNLEVKVSLTNEAATDLEVKIHQGRLAEGKVVWEGMMLQDQRALTARFYAPGGEPLYLSFGGTSGTIHGTVSWAPADLGFLGSGDLMERVDLTPRRTI